MTDEYLDSNVNQEPNTYLNTQYHSVRRMN